MGEQPYTFDYGDAEPSIESAVFQALGTASVCWSEFPQGVFDSDQAMAVGEALLAEIARLSQDSPAVTS
jgi:hypothetical protein